MSVTVVVTDNETGEDQVREVKDGDYVLICTDPCYLAHTQSTGSIHVLTIKGRMQP